MSAVPIAPVELDGSALPVPTGRTRRAADPTRAPTTFVYATFCGLGGSWASDAARVSAAVGWACERFAAIIAADGGEPVTAPLGDCCARFGDAGSAVAAAAAIRRTVWVAGELAVRVAVTSGAALGQNATAVSPVRRARILAEGAGAGECVLAEGVLAQISTRQLPEARVRRTIRRLPGPGTLEQVALLRDAVIEPSAALPAARWL